MALGDLTQVVWLGKWTTLPTEPSFQFPNIYLSTDGYQPLLWALNCEVTYLSIHAHLPTGIVPKTAMSGNVYIMIISWSVCSLTKMAATWLVTVSWSPCWPKQCVQLHSPSLFLYGALYTWVEICSVKKLAFQHTILPGKHLALVFCSGTSNEMLCC